MKNIVIVDDSAIFQRIIEGLLKPHFKIVGKGFSGIDAIELYQKHLPDLLLLDITMPNCDGKECLKKLLSLHPNATVVMVSGIADELTAKECIQLGAKAFVSKGQISTANRNDCDLVKTINSVLRTSSEKLEAA